MYTNSKRPQDWIYLKQKQKQAINNPAATPDYVATRTKWNPDELELRSHHLIQQPVSTNTWYMYPNMRVERMVFTTSHPTTHCPQRRHAVRRVESRDASLSPYLAWEVSLFLRLSWLSFDPNISPNAVVFLLAVCFLLVVVSSPDYLSDQQFGNDLV